MNRLDEEIQKMLNEIENNQIEFLSAVVPTHGDSEKGCTVAQIPDRLILNFKDQVVLLGQDISISGHEYKKYTPVIILSENEILIFEHQILSYTLSSYTKQWYQERKNEATKINFPVTKGVHFCTVFIEPVDWFTENTVNWLKFLRQL